MIQLQTTLRQLRLSGLMRTLDVRLIEAAASRLSHSEFLELIFQDELNVRHQRRLARRTKAADFRTLKSLEDFDCSSIYPSTANRSSTWRQEAICAKAKTSRFWARRALAKRTWLKLWVMKPSNRVSMSFTARFSTSCAIL